MTRAASMPYCFLSLVAAVCRSWCGFQTGTSALTHARAMARR
jgi:hypothetical protein